VCNLFALLTLEFFSLVVENSAGGDALSALGLSACAGKLAPALFWPACIPIKDSFQVFLVAELTRVQISEVWRLQPTRKREFRYLFSKVRNSQ
jgi:hypothetical protein